MDKQIARENEMPRRTKAEIEQSLVQGARIPWDNGGRQDLLELATPVRRRLFAFLLQSKIRVVKGLPAEFVLGLAEAFDSDIDPATVTPTSGSQPRTAGPWHLTRIEAEGFGGINVWGGTKFDYELNEESLLIDGPNGSGKSSLVAALIWALTGQRPRDSSRGAEESSQSQVFDSNGSKVGDWPPLACYPDKVGLLATSPFVQVKLTFKNVAGDEATVDRTLSNGQFNHNVDPRLEFPPVLIETGLVMPTRLAHIRFGAGEEQLTAAVQMLTGLDEIALLGEFVGELCHKSRDYLGYSKAQRRDELAQQFADALSTTRIALASIEQKLPQFIPSDTRDKLGPMAELGKSLSEKAATAVSVISADLGPNLDLTLATAQQQVAVAIDAAKTEMDQGLSGLSLWTTILTVQTELPPDTSARLTTAVAEARTRLQEALELNKKAIDDSRFQLKAIAAAWHQQHSSGTVDDCPLCAQSLKNNPGLVAEIEHFRSVGDAAQRTYRDNVNAIQRDLEAAIPISLRRLRNDVIAVSPKRDIEAALRDRFVDAQRYATCLTGLAGLASAALLNVPGQDLSEVVVPIAAEGVPEGTLETLSAIAIAERFLNISEWATKNKALWEQWWADLTGQTHSPVPQDSFCGKLAQLDDAMRASTPYRDAAKGLREAWKHGLAIDVIDIEQKRRQDIADELEPLKALRKFAEAETKNAIEGLSSRMAKLLDGIHIVEKLKFHSTHMDKKTGVTVRGGFDPDIRIDASLVANASWLRALLWSFVFAVRQEAVEQLGEDRLPLLVLDDPQSTFDLTHRHRWAQYIAALQAAPTSIQIVLATYDESFLAQLETDKVEGIRAYIAAANSDTGCLCLVEGNSLTRSWADATSKKTPEAAQAFISKARIYLETILKIMLRGEGETRRLVIGELREKIKQLHQRGVTPWNRSVFRDLAKHSDICNAALLNYTDDSSLLRRCHHEKAGNRRS
ncbi:MAG: AAA family ATPase [Burkholderiaceae bacterium]|nr:AAA family ATPase [Sulfuritalea sp.]MCF8175813.1 AAA family ATPase [Burkholderiaceae bacterium]MCF8184824.1 AAA family ATPase [Polynucleobacter sp.]